MNTLKSLIKFEYDFDSPSENRKNLRTMERTIGKSGLMDLIQLYHGNQDRLRYAFLEYDLGKKTHLLNRLLTEVGISGDDSMSDAINQLSFDTEATDLLVGMIMTPIRLKLEGDRMVSLLQETGETYYLIDFLEVENGKIRVK